MGFRLFEQLLGSAEQLARVRARVEPSKEQMVGLGMPEFTVEDFYDNFMESLGQLGGEDKVAAAELDTMFNDEGVSNYLVVFLRWGSPFTSTSTLQSVSIISTILRLLTSKQLQLEGEFYQNFMEGGRTVAEFCNTEVEPMYKESDHIHIIGQEHRMNNASVSDSCYVVRVDSGGGYQRASGVPGPRQRRRGSPPRLPRGQSP